MGKTYTVLSMMQTIFIETLGQKIGTYDEGNYKKAAVYMAEARCLRAMYYFRISTLVWECSIDNQYCSNPVNIHLLSTKQIPQTYINL